MFVVLLEPLSRLSTDHLHRREMGRYYGALLFKNLPAVPLKNGHRQTRRNVFSILLFYIVDKKWASAMSAKGDFSTSSVELRKEKMIIISNSILQLINYFHNSYYFYLDGTIIEFLKLWLSLVLRIKNWIKSICQGNVFVVIFFTPNNIIWYLNLYFKIDKINKEIIVMTNNFVGERYETYY